MVYYMSLINGHSCEKKIMDIICVKKIIMDIICERKNIRDYSNPSSMEI